MGQLQNFNCIFNLCKELGVAPPQVTIRARINYFPCIPYYPSITIVEDNVTILIIDEVRDIDELAMPFWSKDHLTILKPVLPSGSVFTEERTQMHHAECLKSCPCIQHSSC
jgi:hypothetical protein